MMDDLKKALNVSKHPGMSSQISLLKLAGRALPYFFDRRGYARPPLTLYWSVNSICNLRCKMCDVGTPNKNSNFFKNLCINGKLHEIAIDRFKSVIDEVARYSPMISITSTEPLLYKPLGEAVAYAAWLGLHVTVTTNGYLLPDRAEELVEAGLSRLNVSIDGPAELHDNIRGRDNCFERAAEGIRLIKNACMQKGRHMEVLACCTISNLNYHSLDACYAAVAELPVDRINFSYMSYVTDAMADEHNKNWGDKFRATVNCVNEYTNPERVDVSLLDAQISTILARKEKPVMFLPRFLRKDLATFFHHPELPMGNHRCMASWFIVEILANGDVVPYARCYPVSLGNINHQSLMEIWNGEKMRTWRRDIRKYKRFPACNRCDQAY